MRKTAWILAAVILAGLSGFSFQETEAGEVREETLPVLKTHEGGFVYVPGNRRDPFRDLLAGRDIPDKSAGTGIGQMSVADVSLIGIVKHGDRLTAIITAPHGFPYFIKGGDKFADGHVLSINIDRVVFRQTRERGIPLLRPKDIVKEINPEER
jgi:Tfp pilus assembly protein PilP